MDEDSKDQDKMQNPSTNISNSHQDENIPQQESNVQQELNMSKQLGSRSQEKQSGQVQQQNHQQTQQKTKLQSGQEQQISVGSQSKVQEQKQKQNQNSLSQAQPNKQQEISIKTEQNKQINQIEENKIVENHEDLETNEKNNSLQQSIEPKKEDNDQKDKEQQAHKRSQEDNKVQPQTKAFEKEQHQEKKQSENNQNPDKEDQNLNKEDQNLENGNENNGNQKQSQKVAKEQLPNQQKENKEPNKQIPEVPEVPSSLIIKQAQKQRISTVYSLFYEHLQKYRKYQQKHENVLNNLYSEFETRKKYKIVPEFAVRNYLQDITKTLSEFHKKSHKPETGQMPEGVTTNPAINSRVQWNQGLQQLQNLKRSLGNQLNKQQKYINGDTIQSIKKIFKEYDKNINAQLKKVADKKQICKETQKQLIKCNSKINKVYSKDLAEKVHDDDMFVQLVKFVNCQQKLKQDIKNWGISLLQARDNIMSHQQTVFQQLQHILISYQMNNNTLYEEKQSTKKKKILKITEQIVSSFKFNLLCPLADIDYIRSVQTVDQKSKRQQMTDQDFQFFVSVEYFDRVVGDASGLLKGMAGKQFNMENKEEILVNTIAGNLIRYNKTTCQLKDKFIVKNLSAKLVEQATVQITESLKGVIYDSDRVVKLKFKDNDRAEQLLTFLASKQ